VLQGPFAIDMTAQRDRDRKSGPRYIAGWDCAEDVSPRCRLRWGKFGRRLRRRGAAYVYDDAKVIPAWSASLVI
jgi:hypothetical protein